MSENENLGDRLPRAEDAEIDPRKFEAYSMDPNNPANQGKWKGFVMLGADVETPEGRQAATQDVIQQLRQVFLTHQLPKIEALHTVFDLNYEYQLRDQTEYELTYLQVGKLIKVKMFPD